MTRVKICGITRAQDARQAAELGAAAIGFVFADSPRRVTVEAARAIVAALPPHVDRVGVFANATVDEIVRVAAAVPLTRIQLHGEELPDVAARLPGALTRALSHDAADPRATIARWRAERPDFNVLLDLPKGAPASELPRLWKLAAELAAGMPLALGGGLDADNVATALAQVRPAAVDVARGVESAPGVKDPARLRAFFAAVYAFDHRAKESP